MAVFTRINFIKIISSLKLCQQKLMADIHTSRSIWHLPELKVAGGKRKMKNPIESFYNWYRNTIRNPQYRWWLVLGTLAYLFSPIDIAPDFLPVVGWIDDAVLTGLLVSEVSQMFVNYVKLRQADKPSETTASANGQTKSAEDTVVEVKAVSVE